MRARTRVRVPVVDPSSRRQQVQRRPPHAELAQTHVGDSIPHDDHGLHHHDAVVVADGGVEVHDHGRRHREHAAGVERAQRQLLRAPRPSEELRRTRTAHGQAVLQVQRRAVRGVCRQQGARDSATARHHQSSHDASDDCPPPTTLSCSQQRQRNTPLMQYLK